MYDGSDNLLMRFEYADGRMPVAMTKGGSTYYLTYDQVGSLRIVADASGNVVKLIDYDSFGNIINDSDPIFEVPFGFAGGLQDRHTGLVRFGYRDYDPDIGRWTAKDPILFAGGDTDLYGYCFNNPVNKVDTFGLDVYRGSRAVKPFESQHGELHHEFIYIQNPKLPGGEMHFGLTADFIYGRGRISEDDEWDVYWHEHDGLLIKEEGINEDLLIREIIEEIKNPPFYGIKGYNCQDWVRDMLEKSREKGKPCK
jgi:RHS repeat-associated protein